MNFSSHTPALLAITLLVSMSLASGCSSSSDSQSMTGADTVDPVATVLDDDALTSGDEIIDPSVVDASDGPADDTTIPADPQSDNPDPVVPDPVVPDPVVQNRTQVNFEITVPAYQSNALQLKIIWGDIDLTASWVGDEYWAAAADLPTNTEHALSVTFYDNNGEIELASFDQTYRTGVNAAETVQISADQFDSNRWDTDADGVSNLDELIAGTSPIVDEESLIEILDSVTDFDARRAIGLLEKYSGYYEDSIPDERPYFEDEQVVTPHYEYAESWGILYDRHTVTIDIDLSGNGTFSDVDRVEHDPSDHTTISQNGTRTNTGSSIKWNGSYSRWNRRAACYTDNAEFTTETSRLSDGRFKQDGVHKHDGWCSSYDANFDTTYTLTGVKMNESSYCAPLFGTITTGNGSGGWKITISKDADDSHWRLSRYDREQQLVEEYFISDIQSSFFCEFSEL